MIHVCFLSVRKPQGDEIGILFAFKISEYSVNKSNQLFTEMSRSHIAETLISLVLKETMSELEF